MGVKEIGQDQGIAWNHSGVPLKHGADQATDAKSVVPIPPGPSQTVTRKTLEAMCAAYEISCFHNDITIWDI